IGEAGGVAEFQLVPLVQALPPMMTSAARRGLSGHVGDLEYAPVAGATVRALGLALTTSTDSTGYFYLPVPAGSHMVSIAKDSFVTRLVSVRMPADSGRDVSAWL